MLGGVLLFFTSILHPMRLKQCLGGSLELYFAFRGGFDLPSGWRVDILHQLPWFRDLF